MKVNLGCGSNLFEGWLNCDIDDVNETYIRHLWDAQNVDGWPEWQQEQWRYLHSGGSGGNFRFRQLDFVHDDWVAELKCEGRCDAIYLGQVVEHLNAREELPKVLAQCLRALKPEGILRMTTPDIDTIVTHYNRDLMGNFASEQPEFYARAHRADQLAYLLFGATGPNCTRKNYEGHFHGYVPDTLLSRCIEAGFSVHDWNTHWPSKRLPDVRDFGQSHSFALEVTKP